MEKHLNVISINVPYPPNYGGMIDIYYKLKTLHAAGIKIILHTFEYGREKAPELEDICAEVHYYKRKTGLLSQFSILPYIVYSRRCKKMLQRLLTNNYPILFEGLHTCYYLHDARLRVRQKMVRLHNIEHEYYAGLARTANSQWEHWYMALESKRLKKYEKQLQHADLLFPLSTVEKEYIDRMYPANKSELLPLFHANDTVGISEKTEAFVLYHGDLSTPDNIRAALFLIREMVAKDQSIQWVIAGLNPHPSIYRAAKELENVEIRANLKKEEIDWLIQHSRVNVLYTNQVSGVKLKLLNALFTGHHCIVNEKMVIGSRLESLCKIAPDHPDAFLESIRYHFNHPFSTDEIEQRKMILEHHYNNKLNGATILKYL